MRPSVKDLKFPFLRIFLHSIMCHKSMPLTIILWAPHRYRSRIWRHRSPDMPVCSSVRSSRFSLSAILSPERLWIHRSPGNPRAGSRPEAVLCGNRNPGPDHSPVSFRTFQTSLFYSVFSISRFADTGKSITTSLYISTFSFSKEVAVP